MLNKSVGESIEIHLAIKVSSDLFDASLCSLLPNILFTRCMVYIALIYGPIKLIELLTWMIQQVQLCGNILKVRFGRLCYVKNYIGLYNY